MIKDIVTAELLSSAEIAALREDADWSDPYGPDSYAGDLWPDWPASAYASVEHARRRRAMELRGQGLKYWEIGAQMGVGASRARDLVHGACWAARWYLMQKDAAYGDRVNRKIAAKAALERDCWERNWQARRAAQFAEARELDEELQARTDIDAAHRSTIARELAHELLGAAVTTEALIAISYALNQADGAGFRRAVSTMGRRRTPS